jgi:hypothetical protein
VAVLAAITLCAPLLSGCERSARPPAPPPQNGTSSMSGVALEGDFSGSGGGTLKSAVTMATVDRRMLKVSSLAARVEFESKSGIDGSTQLVSGSVFVPNGPPPPPSACSTTVGRPGGRVCSARSMPLPLW